MESWQTINQLLNKRYQSTNIVSLKDSNQTIFDKESISNKMNESFVPLAKSLLQISMLPQTPFSPKKLVSTMMGGPLISGQLIKGKSKKQCIRFN